MLSLTHAKRLIDLLAAVQILKFNPYATEARMISSQDGLSGSISAAGATSKNLFAIVQRFNCAFAMNSLRIHVLLAILVAQHLATPAARAESPAAEMALAANNFLAALNPELKAKAVFEFKGQERVNWHFVPMPRKGLPFKEMSPAQRHLAYALLHSALSQRGYFKAVTIMSLEQVLYDLENQASHRDAELYYFSIFGKPGPDAWGWRVEGHHLSLNFTVRGDIVIAATPSFLGSNPAEVRAGPRQGLRVLAQEEDLGRRLVKSLDDQQRAVAIISTNAPRDVITGNSRTARALAPVGLPAAQMNASQRDQLKALIGEYIGRTRPAMAETEWAKIQAAGWEKVSFAWAGALEPGHGHYYRVQGPTFLLEYDNTQNEANHIHTVWRDLGNDFGDDTLRRHYEQVPHGK